MPPGSGSQAVDRDHELVDRHAIGCQRQDEPLELRGNGGVRAAVELPVDRLSRVRAAAIGLQDLIALVARNDIVEELAGVVVPFIVDDAGPGQAHPIPNRFAVAYQLDDLDMADPGREAFGRKIRTRGQVTVAAMSPPPFLDCLELLPEWLRHAQSPPQLDRTAMLPTPRLGAPQCARA